MRSTSNIKAIGYEDLEDFLRVNHNVILGMLRDSSLQSVEVLDIRGDPYYDPEEEEDAEQTLGVVTFLLTPRFKKQVIDTMEECLNEYFEA